MSGIRPPPAPAEHDSAPDRQSRLGAPFAATHRRVRPDEPAGENVQQRCADRASHASEPSSGSRLGCGRTPEPRRPYFRFRRRSHRSDSSADTRRRLPPGARLPAVSARTGPLGFAMATCDPKILSQPGDCFGSMAANDTLVEFEFLREPADQAQARDHPAQPSAQSSHVMSAQEFMQGWKALVNPPRYRDRQFACVRMWILICNRCFVLHERTLVENFHDEDRVRSSREKQRRQSRKNSLNPRAKGDVLRKSGLFQGKKGG